MQKAILEIIKDIELFAGLSDEERERLGKIFTFRTLPVGSYLFEANDPREALYVIIEGAVELIQSEKFGSSRRIVVFGKNDFVGEGALLDDSPHSLSAQALVESRIGLITRDAFQDLFQNDADIAKKILSRVARVMGRRMRQAITRESNESAQYTSGRTRTEHDLLGDKDVPHDAYYGIQTLRGIENFHITGVPISHYPNLINALAYVKMAAARANTEIGLMSEEIGEAIVQAGNDVVQGKLHNHFVLDMIQGGAGTSTNMNVNEVLANRANEILGHKRGEYIPVHPNNHVNMSQSTNDAYPSSLKIAMALSNMTLVLELEELVESFLEKAKDFAHILKMGRTQLQDAVPMTLGQEFEAYAVALADEIRNLNENAKLLLKLNMGGTAIGTGLNAAPEFGSLSVRYLREMTGLEVTLAKNLIESTQSTSAFVMYSAALKQLAVKLSKISNDLRLLSSGPRAGINEINLPKMQPGSSIMPGKVNPVIPEVMNQVAFKVIGDDLTVTLAAEAGQLELNVMEPVIADCIFESIEMLKNGISTFKHRCVDGITANEDVCKKYVETSIGLVTALNPVLGYETSTQLAKEALETNKGIYELVLEKELMSQEELDEALDPKNMIKPQLQAKK